MIRVALAVLALAFLSSPAAGLDFAQIKTRGTLRVIVANDEQPEMFAQKPGSAPGFDRELLDGFASLHRIKVEAVVLPFEEGIPALLADKGDVVIELIDTEARRKSVVFTAEILPTRTIVVNRKPDAPIATLEAFRAARVGVVAGTGWVDAAVSAGVPAARLESFPDLGAAFAAMKAKRIQATPISLVDATLAIRKDPDLQAGVALGEAGRACYAVRKSDPELRQALDDYIEGMRKAGTWSRLVVKYFGDRALSILGRGPQ